MTKSRKNRRGGRRNANNIDRLMLNNSKETGSATSSVPFDLIRRRQNFNITQTPPKSLGNQIYWFKELVRFTFNTSTSTFAENNFSFKLSDLQDSSAITAMFDQYCIYAVAANLSLDTTTSNPHLVILDVISAIDYDSTGNIGPAGIQAFNSAVNAKVTTQTSHSRFVKPCVAPALYNNSVFTSYGIARLWIDSQSADAAHYGLRYIILQSPNVVTVELTLEYVIGCRNKH